MPQYAQTNIQLLNQLRQQGYAPDDRALVARAYRFSLPLFSGRFRASGKTFFAHMTGTASILASLRLDGAVVTAGLLHAAYTHGDFGDGRHGIRDEKRAAVRDAVGDRAEDYIARYTTLDWNVQSMPLIPAMLERLDRISREVITMRVANELDEYLDLGAWHAGGDGRRVLEHTARLKPALVEIAEGLGRPELAREITRVLDETLAADLSAFPAADDACDESFVVPAASQRRLVDAMAVRLSARPGGTK